VWSVPALATILLVSGGAAALAQGPPGGPPPAVGVVKAEKRPITQSNEFIGRIQAINRVDVVARVTAFVDKVEFKDGAEVKAGDVLYRLERGPFEADLDAKKSVAQQFDAQLQNANISLERAQTLLKSQAGAQATVDSALATQRSTAAQLLGANANVKTSEINLGYTVIKSPIDGKIGRTAITAGNVVTPGSGILATIVGQDPMYVTFPVSLRTEIELRERYANKGGFKGVILRILLPSGRYYSQSGTLTFTDNTIQAGTDTITLRGTIANPIIPADKGGDGTLRELADNEFVTVEVQGIEPVFVLAIPRAAILSDQKGDYVYTVGPDNKAQRADIKLGQSTPTVASIEGGLQEGDMVIVDGLQRVRIGQPVSPGPPAVPPPGPDAAAAATKQ
jgi:membrane fusion protein (multidrug efflux system)